MDGLIIEPGHMTNTRTPASLVRCSATELSSLIPTVLLTKSSPSKTHMTNTSSPCQDYYIQMPEQEMPRHHMHVVGMGGMNKY